VIRFLVAGALFCAGAAAVDFRNVARQAGLVDVFPNGGSQSKQYIIETTGSGAAFLDYDNDGLLDVFLVSGPGGTNRLYHNLGNGRFADVAKEMGLAHTGWGQGVCAGDFDNDGYVDLLVTYWGANVLYRNRSGQGFEDVTARAHLKQDRVRYNTGCAFLDYDNDSHLDIFVANYLKFDFANTPKPGDNSYCWYRDLPVACGPRGLPFDRNILYHNNGDGTFTDVSEASGIAKPARNYSLGVLTGDFNQDGLTDIYVACDRTPSILYINRGDGTFTDEAMIRGAALDDNGKALSGMGVAAADYDDDGWPDIFRSNFSDERETLYRNRGKGEFDDVTVPAGMALNTRFVGWGCGFLDFDNNGWKGLLLVNGHAFPEVDRLGIDVHYKDRALVYRNTGKGKFIDISASAGPGILERHSARGAAFGDYDNDGSLEVLVNNQNEPPTLLKQSANPTGDWVLLKLVGVKSNRSAIGARVRLSAGGLTQTDQVHSGGSYLSQSDLRLHFGLGPARRIDRIEIDWPSGVHQEEKDLEVNRVITVREKWSNKREPTREQRRTSGEMAR
jgi:enediyne biosynthesis protein E4